MWLEVPEMKKLVEETLGDAPLLYTYLNKAEVQKLLKDFYNKKDETAYYKIWTILCLALWFNSHNA